MTILEESTDLSEQIRLADGLFEEALEAYENGQYKDCAEK